MTRGIAQLGRIHDRAVRCVDVIECTRCGKDIHDHDFFRAGDGELYCWDCTGRMIDAAEFFGEADR